jgi:hypothetical protein
MADTILPNPTNTEQSAFELIDLPSGGYFYKPESPLASGKIKLRYPTTKQEDILLSQNLLQQGIAVDEFIKSLIIELIDYNEILLADVRGLMYASRILLYGPNFDTEIQCPSCKRKTPKSFDLSLVDFVEKDYEGLGFQRGENLFSFTTSNGISIKFSLPTNGDELRIKGYVNAIGGGRNKTTNELSPSVRLSFAIKEIIEPNSNVVIKGQPQIYKYLTNTFRSQQSKELRDYIEKISPNVNIKSTFECDHCTYSDDRFSIPIDKNFFWPQ